MATFNNGESGSSVRAKINAVLQHADGTAGEIVFNDAGADVDFRIESDTNANAFFLDGATGNLGLGVTPSASKLDVFDNTVAIATRTLIRARDNAQSGSNVLAETKAIQFIGAANTEVGYLSFQHNQGYGEFGSVDLAAIGGSRPLRFFTNGTERARIDSSGNLGLGVTPNVWASNARAIQFGNYGSLYQNSSGYPELAFNTFQNASNIYVYRNTDLATRYSQTNGQHQWFTAPSGTAGNTITFTQAMTLNASGNLFLGTTSGDGRLTVVSGSLQHYGSLDATSSSYGYLTLKAQGTPYGYIGQASALISGGATTDAALRSEANLVFTTNGGAERMRIDSSGKLLIGTTASGGSKLRISGLPTSSAGLSAGDVWNDGGTLKIV